MLSVGQVLRAEREKLELSQEDIVQRTKISKLVLQAIENDNLAPITNFFYYESFVKQLAAAVHVEFTSLLPALELAAVEMRRPLLPGEEDRAIAVASYVPPSPGSRGRTATTSILSLLAVLLLCSAVYALSNRSKHTPTSAEHNTPQAQPTESSKALPAPAEVTASAPVSQSIQVQVAAVEKTWLSLETDGRNIYSGLLEPADTKVLTGNDSATLKTGNAGGLTVIFNGKPLGVLGRRGEVQTVRFTRDQYEIFPTGLVSRLQLLPAVMPAPQAE